MSGQFARTLSDGRAGFPALLDAVAAHLKSHGVPSATAAQLMIVIDEIVSNALDHGDAARVEVRLDLGNARLTGEVTDDGRPFDPLAADPPDTSRSLDERAIGGLGLHLVRQLVDQLAYARDAGRNRLRFSKTFALE